MHIDDLLGTEDFAAEAGDTVLAVFDDRKLKGRVQAGNDTCGRRGLHVDDIGGADNVADAAAGTFIEFDAFNHELFRQLLSYFSDRFVQA
jgi:hypothetical protein